MGKRLPLKPSVAKRYSEELAVAERMAKQGFSEDVYGPKNMKFDPLTEMQYLKDNNVTDNSFMEASMSELKSQSESVMLEQAAIQAVVEEQAPQVVQVPPQAPQVQAPVMAPEEQEEEEETLPEDPEARLLKIHEELVAVMGAQAPTEQMLRQWKALHGDVFILLIENRVFIYRFLKRQEWVQMQVNPANATLRPDQHEDIMFSKCLLWPQLISTAALPAGAVSLIVEQIKLQSLFLDPVQVANITIKL